MAAHFPPYEDVDKRPRQDSDELHRRLDEAFDEQRADIIGQNSNEGWHYESLYPPQNNFKEIPVKETKALDTQVGGTHYKELGIEPLELVYLNFGYYGLKASIYVKVNKYLTRKKDSEVEDIKKAIHCLEVLLDRAKEEQK